jgi:pilus assembly protein CpaE
MGNHIRILVADDSDVTRNAIIKITNMVDNFEVIGEAVNGEIAIKKTKELKPDVVLMDINMPIINGLEATEEISKQCPNVIVIIMSVQGGTEYLKKAMLSGAKEYIFKPFSIEELIDTVNTTIKLNKERRSNIEIISKKVNDAKIISFFSAKGGVGKSVLAFNYAIKLATIKKKKVLLIDGDLLFGDIAVLADEKPIKTIYDVIEDMALDSFEFLKEYIIETKYKIDVLLAPKRPENAESITEENIMKILELVKKNYDYIVIDLGTNFNNNTLSFLDISDEIFLITTANLMGVKNTKIGIDVMKSLEYSEEKIKVIINKYEKNSDILENDLKKYINFPIYFTLPEDRKAIENSINTGKPINTMKLFSKSKFEKALINLVEMDS